MVAYHEETFYHFYGIITFYMLSDFQWHPVEGGFTFMYCQCKWYNDVVYVVSVRLLKSCLKCIIYM